MNKLSEVAPFCTRFQRLKGFLDNDPQNLLGDAIRDDGIRDLCEKLRTDAFFLENAEKSHPQLFIKDVDATFIELWRDYHKRWADMVGWIAANVFFDDQGWNEEVIEDALRRKRPDIPTGFENWQESHGKAIQAVGGIGAALNFAEDQISQEDHEFQVDLVEEIAAGIDAWKDIGKTVGLDLIGILRRRSLLPVVFLPKTISDSQGEKVKTALLANLHHAQRVFTYAGSDAALPLLRATMERVIEDHFPAFGRDLAAKIDNLKSRAALPVGCLSRKLHELRKAANDVLHGSDPRLIYASSVEELADKELAAVEHFVQVRILIESVK